MSGITRPFTVTLAGAEGPRSTLRRRANTDRSIETETVGTTDGATTVAVVNDATFEALRAELPEEARGGAED